MNEIIVADASPLIAFGRINQISLLNKLFGTVIIPQTVVNECLIDSMQPGAKAIQKAINDGNLQVYSDPPLTELSELTDILDKGEAAAIKLSSIHNFPLIIDEKLGRAVATKLKIKIIGSAGILLLAKQRKHISSITPLISQLKDANYYLADKLVKDLLIRAEE